MSNDIVPAGGPSLLAAVNAVMKAVVYVQKGDYNEQQRFRYAGEAAIIGALRAAMVDNGLVIVPEEIVSGETAEYTTAKGTVMHRTDIRIRYRLWHISGESLTLMEAGTGMDAGDKDAYKALTGAYKYALRHVFCLETGDDPDKASPDDQTARKPRTSRAVQPAREPYGEPPDGMIGGDSDDLAPPLPATPPSQPRSAPEAVHPGLQSVYCMGGAVKQTRTDPPRSYIVYKLQRADGSELMASYWAIDKAQAALGMEHPEQFVGDLVLSLETKQGTKGPLHTITHMEAPAGMLPPLSKGE